MAQLNIKVGASVDRNLGVAFQPIIEAAKRAKRAIEAESKTSGRAISTEVRKGTKSAELAFKELEAKAVAGMPRVMNKAGEATKAFAKDAKASLNVVKANFAEMAKEAEKQLEKISKAQKNVTKMNFGGVVRSQGGSAFNSMFAGGTAASGAAIAGSVALGAAKKAASAAIGIAKSLAAGAGVDTDIGSIIKKNVDLESMAQDLANASYQYGDKRNGQRINKNELMNQALDIGTKTGTSANEVIEGLGKFVGLTGDLQTGREVMEDLLKLSKATGSSFDDMAAAAGNVANALPDTADKGAKVQAVMRVIAGQGKLGAVEIKDMAAQMAKIAAAAGSFGGKAEDNIATLGAMAQTSRSKGGSSSPTAAATAIASWVSMLKTPKRAKEFEAATGAKVYDPKTGMLRDSQVIIKEALAKVGMDPIKLKTIFQNNQGARAMEGYANIFRAAGGGEAGQKAVDEEFRKQKAAVIANTEVEESFARAMKTSASQAEIFNNQIRKSALQMQSDLAPALASLAAAIVPAVAELGKWVTFLTGDKQASTISGLAEGDVGAAVTSTKKMMEGGKISDAQIEQNRIAANEALESKSRAAAELLSAKETLATKQKNNDYSGWFNPVFANKADDANSFWGRMFGGSEEADKKNIQEKQAALEKANATYDKIAANNDEVKKALQGKLLVQIANVDELRASMSPETNGNGVSPSPEAKAGKK